MTKAVKVTAQAPPALKAAQAKADHFEARYRDENGVLKRRPRSGR